MAGEDRGARRGGEERGRTVVVGNLGRLGQALMASAPGPVRGWDRPELDLDDPATGVAMVEREQPDLVIHTAAMTAVDEAAREPELAMRRNGDFVGDLARACRKAGARFLFVSTNEVFDGQRLDARGYREDDETNPPNAYGRSKRAGEVGALDAYGWDGRGDAPDGLWIVRTAWLFGPPGGDFPDKITNASDRFDGEPLTVVADEIGNPTYTRDLAPAIHRLTAMTTGGIYHLVNATSASRYDWAKAVLDVRRPGRELRQIMLYEYERHSDPPPWGALDTSKAAAAGITLRRWEEALAEYLRR